MALMQWMFSKEEGVRSNHRGPGAGAGTMLAGPSPMDMDAGAVGEEEDSPLGIRAVCRRGSPGLIRTR